VARLTTNQYDLKTTLNAKRAKKIDVF